MSVPTCSLNISTYNWPKALQLCLDTVLLQKKLPDEIVIVDDGSDPGTKAVVDKFIAKSPVPVVHVWHEDKGFRLAEIRNKAFAKSSSDYIIQIDADCLLHPLFIEDHLRFAKAGTFVCGSRSMINEEFTRELLQKNELKILPDWKNHLSKKGNAIHNSFLSAVNYRLQRAKKNYKYVKGCNMAFWKKDLLKVNGYNEVFTGWGKEDNDLALRLLNAGIAIRFAKFTAVQYHLHHEISDLSELSINEQLLKETETKGLVYAEQGIVKEYITALIYFLHIY